MLRHRIDTLRFLRMNGGAAFAALLLATAACSSDAPAPPTQVPGNGGVSPRFESGIPRGWFGQNDPARFDVGIDAGIRRGGTAALYLRSTGQPAGNFAFVGQALAAESYRGQRLRLSAWIRADTIAGGFGGLWMRIDGATRTVEFDNMIGFGRGISGTSDWVQRSVVLDVPAEAIQVTIGALLSGTGTMRVDDMRLDRVDPSIAPTTTGQTGPIGQDSVSFIAAAQRLPSTPVNLDFDGVASIPVPWFATAVRPFTTDAPGSGFDDLDELGRIVGTARVVGFGEATHGTREFFRMKHRALEYLVERQGFTHFTIEATMPESRAVDRYVTRGEGDPARLLSNLGFWTWNTQEVLDMIRWMREYNVRAGTPRLRFFGFDMQSPQQSIDSVSTMLLRLDPTLGARSIDRMACLSAARTSRGTYDAQQYQQNTSSASRAACADSLRTMVADIVRERPRWSGQMAADDLDWLEQYARLVQQWQLLGQAASNTSFAVRDRAMADNLLWVASTAPGARLFAWAHNLHVTRQAPAMGKALAEALGENYRAIAFTFGTGGFSAVGRTNTSIGSLGAFNIPSVSSGTLEALFAESASPRLIFDARRMITAGDAAASLRNQPIPMRAIGATFDPASAAAANFFSPVLLPQDFDAVIWFATTQPSVLLPFVR